MTSKSPSARDDFAKVNAAYRCNAFKSTHRRNGYGKAAHPDIGSQKSSVMIETGENRMRSSFRWLRQFICSYRLDAGIWRTTKKVLSCLLLALALVSGLRTVSAATLVMTTYVSGNGKDSNPCTTVRPCQTLQGALAKTSAGGQIHVLDFADYGSVTVTKSISILGGSGAAGVLATTNVSGIIINAGANDVINLQGLDIDGAGVGANGIRSRPGHHYTSKTASFGDLQTGSLFNPALSTLLVETTLVSNNTTGVNFQNSSASTGVLNNVQMINNASGIVAAGASSTAQANLTVQASMVANNNTVGILAGSFSLVTVSNTTIANNGVGLKADSASALLQVTGSTVSGNGTAGLRRTAVRSSVQATIPLALTKLAIPHRRAQFQQPRTLNIQLPTSNTNTNSTAARWVPH